MRQTVDEMETVYKIYPDDENYNEFCAIFRSPQPDENPSYTLLA